MAWTLEGNLKGPPGTDGTAGSSGENAFTVVVEPFTCPPIGETVEVAVESVAFMVLGQTLWVESAGGGTSIAGEMQVVAINGNPPGPYREIATPVLPPPKPRTPPPPKPKLLSLNAIDASVVPPAGRTVTVNFEDLTGVAIGKCLAVSTVEAEGRLRVIAKLEVTAVSGNSVTLFNPG
jgi:hypothetical protein